MQSLTARTEYRNFIHCGYRIFTEEGVLRFWKGTTPRLARLTVSCHGTCLSLSHTYTDARPPSPSSRASQLSGGIVFSVYEQTIALIGGRKEVV
jgi:solute carrier family 25 citrate transporter 1